MLGFTLAPAFLAAWWLLGIAGWAMFHIAVQIHELDFARSRKLHVQEPVRVTALSVSWYILGGWLGAVVFLTGAGFLACILIPRSGLWLRIRTSLSSVRIA